MSYRDYLFTSPLLEEEAESDKKRQVKTSTWEKINPLYWLGNATGRLHRGLMKGFHNGYGGAQDYRIQGYVPHKAVEESADCLFNCEPIGNSLYKNNINGNWFKDREDKGNKNYSLFRGPGDEWSTEINEPSFRAARTVNSSPHFMAAYNGINKVNEEMEPFSLKNYRNY